MSVGRAQLVTYLDELLCVDLFHDYTSNGLQVEGTDQINVLCTAVTASLDAINQAISYHADALLVHHGYFWKGESPVITGMKRARMASLITNNINLIAYHLPLDAHENYGNNVGLGKALGLTKIQSKAAMGQPDLLWSGQFKGPVSAQTLSNQLERILQRKPLVFNARNADISKVAWCTGGAQDLIELAYQMGVDAFISGEVSERTYYIANELGIDYFASGHHATERFGVQLLGEHLKNQFSVTHQFIDSANPV
jgi:dinuclear metal center YbgI/SA1388 family protein